MQNQDRQTPRRIAVSGATGLVGSALRNALQADGRTVIPITRSTNPRPDAVAWNTDTNTFDADALAGCDAVVHLAGESIMGRWSDSKKQRIRDSRIASTRALSQTLADLEDGPRVLIAASAVGYYGDTAQTNARTEDDPPGQGFLAEVCVDWEAAAEPAREANLRVVHARIGVVLSPDGGALATMLTPFKLGLGGRVGNGKQWMSTIGLHDLVRMLVFCLDHPNAKGPINAVAPNPVTNAQFTKALGSVLHRPTLFPAPPAAIKAIYGSECAEGIVLASIRVKPKRLTDLGFSFDFPDVEDALRHELKRD